MLNAKSLDELAARIGKAFEGSPAKDLEKNVKAMLQSGIYPDFIVVDGKEGGTGAAPVEFTNHIGMPLRESLLFVHNVLVGCNLREHIRIGASGKIVSAFDIASVLAMGADWVNSARGFMFAIGCIQSQHCHTNRCPTGVATQDPLRQRALVVPDKADRVFSFHRNTVHALAELLAAAGLSHPAELGPHHLIRRISDTEIKLFSQLYYFVQPGALLRELLPLNEESNVTTLPMLKAATSALDSLPA